MRCPVCGYSNSKVVDSRPSEDAANIRRRRECLDCGHRFTTYERLADTPIVIIKSDGSVEAYDRQKLFKGLLIACAKRPISTDQILALINDIETELRSSRQELSSKELGDMALQRLAKLDEVAYIRFASVYKDFKNAEEFRSALSAITS